MEKATPEMERPSLDGLCRDDREEALLRYHTYLDDSYKAMKALLPAARSGLLDDAALGRAVWAAAERDGPEREAMAAAILDALCDDETTDKLAQAAARALLAMKGTDNA